MSNRGFTLVELMVSAIIIALAIAGVVAVARKSREIDVTAQHQCTARAFLDSCFESAAYSHVNYDNLADNTATVVIEDRPEKFTDLTGKLTITVTQMQTNDLNSAPVPYKQVSATLSWEEPEGTQSLTETKAVVKP